jgi:hypothetical protein
VCEPVLALNNNKKTKAMEDYKEEVKFGKKLIYWFIALSIVLSIGGYVLNKGKEATHIDDAVQNYEEFQNLYNTCVKLNTDLCNMNALDGNDKMFESFSKAQRLNAIKTNLNRWVEEYNAKSKMWGRNLWRSKALPQTLNVNDFNCY